MSISFIYFDIGGVTILDFSGNNKWEEMKRDLNIPASLDQEFDEYYDELSRSLHVGKELDMCLPDIAKRFDLVFPANYSMLADFIMRFKPNEFIWSVIQQAKQKSNIGLLTNMYPRMLDSIKEAELLPQINWDVVIDSSIVKLQKPDKEIFAYAQAEAGVPGKNIFFIDNDPRNIDAARDLGWQAYLYDPSNPEKSSQELAQII